jgi:putative PIN family toxin of toxin-antitoxin system
LKKPIRGIKVFIDTNVLIAGIASVTGASATVLDLCEAESIQMVISQQVLVEADRNFSSKLPGLVTQFRQFIRNLAPLMVEDPPATAVQRAATLIAQKDASILAAALGAKVDYLITPDKKHFLNPKVKKSIPIEICSPADFLRIFEGLWLQE